MIGKNVSYSKDVKILLFGFRLLFVDDNLVEFGLEIPDNIIDTLLTYLHHEYLPKVVPHLLTMNDTCKSPKIFFFDKLKEAINEANPSFQLEFLSDMNLDYQNGEISFDCPGIDLEENDNFDYFSADFDRLPINVNLILARACTLTGVLCRDIQKIKIRFYDPYVMDCKTSGPVCHDIFYVDILYAKGKSIFTINKFFDDMLREDFFIK
jgi:hypothetical protein